MASSLVGFVLTSGVEWVSIFEISVARISCLDDFEQSRIGDNILIRSVLEIALCRLINISGD